MSKNCGGPCGDHARPAADTDMQASSDASGEWVSVYAVPKMDCPSEERMIRLALNGVEGIRALSFDLSNRRLKVVHDGEVEPVTSKLKTLGLGASLQETVAANPETVFSFEVTGSTSPSCTTFSRRFDKSKDSARISSKPFRARRIIRSSDGQSIFGTA